MCRLSRLAKLDSDPFYARHAKRLKAEERAWIQKYLADNAQVEKNQFAHNVNRLWIDDSARPKNHTLMWEILSILA